MDDVSIVMDARPTHLAMYYLRERVGGAHDVGQRHYIFCVGIGRNFGKTMAPAKKNASHIDSMVYFLEGKKADLIKTIKITAGQQKYFGRYMRRYSSERTPAVGYITYDMNGKTAYANWYYPKPETPEGRKMRGLGYSLEAMATEHLIKQGITHMHAGTIRTSPAREKQLKTVGLSMGEYVEIQKWLEGLRKGIRLSV